MAHKGKLLISIFILFALSTCWAQKPLIIHPLLGETIDFKERKKNGLDKVLKLPIPVWHSLAAYVGEDGKTYLRSLEDSSLNAFFLSEDDLFKLMMSVEENNGPILVRIDQLKKKLESQDSVLVILKLKGDVVSQTNVIGFNDNHIILSEGPVEQLELPLEDLQKILIYGQDFRIREFKSGYNFTRDRLFYTNTALLLGKNELTYQNLMLLGQRFRYGLNNKISISLGFDPITHIASIADRYYYGIVEASVMAGGKLPGTKWRLAGEARVIVIGYDANFFALSAVATRGTVDENISLRLFATTPNYSYTSIMGASFGLTKKLNSRWRLVSENIVLGNKSKWENFNPNRDRILYNWLIVPSIGTRYIKGRHSFDMAAVVWSALSLGIIREHLPPYEVRSSDFTMDSFALFPIFTYSYWINPRL
ncbi:MAG: hypothetical protein MRZ79_23160 [Bacteroidia bacterium]|nr:hypothetical protein [Bacteroidia bacterium]